MVLSLVVDGFIGGLIGSIDSGACACVCVYFKVKEFRGITPCKGPVLTFQYPLLSVTFTAFYGHCYCMCAYKPS